MDRQEYRVLKPYNQNNQHNSLSRNLPQQQALQDIENISQSKDNNYLLTGQEKKNQIAYMNQQNYGTKPTVKQNEQSQTIFHDNPYYNKAVFEQPCDISILSYQQEQLSFQQQQQKERFEEKEEDKCYKVKIEGTEPIQQYYNVNEQYQGLRQKYYNQSTFRNEAYGQNMYSGASILTGKSTYETKLDYQQQGKEFSDNYHQENHQFNQQNQQRQNFQPQQVESSKREVVQKSYQQQQNEYSQNSKEISDNYYQPQTSIMYSKADVSNGHLNHYITNPQHSKIPRDTLNSQEEKQYQQHLKGEFKLENVSPSKQLQYRERLQHLEDLKRRVPTDQFSTQLVGIKAPLNDQQRVMTPCHQDIHPQATVSRLQDSIQQQYHSSGRQQQRQYLSPNIQNLNNQPHQLEYCRSPYQKGDLKQNSYPNQQRYVQTESRNNQQCYENDRTQERYRDDSYERERNQFYQLTSHIIANSIPYFSRK